MNLLILSAISFGGGKALDTTSGVHRAARLESYFLDSDSVPLSGRQAVTDA